MKTAIVNFNGGEYSPKIDARADTEKHAGGCRILENMIPSILGGAEKRPGTELIIVGNGYACYYEAPIADPVKIQIYTMADLLLIGNDVSYPLDGDYELMNNIDMSASAALNGGQGWKGIGTSYTAGVPTSFTGTFEGNYFTLSNLTIDTTTLTPYTLADGGARGLFGMLEGATVSNLFIEDMSHTTQGICGGLVGYVSLSTITNVYVTGTFVFVGTNNNGAGGGMAYETESGKANTWTRCGVNINWIASGKGHIASGFVGLNGFMNSVSADIFTDCYAVSTITHIGADTVGLTNCSGFIFQHDASSISCTNCYAAQNTGLLTMLGTHNGGFVGWDQGGTQTYTSCYYNSDLSLDDESEAVGKTTAQMYAEATFTNWDFDTVWQIDEGSGYPTHQWQKTADIKKVCKRI